MNSSANGNVTACGPYVDDGAKGREKDDEGGRETPGRKDGGR